MHLHCRIQTKTEHDAVAGIANMLEDCSTKLILITKTVLIGELRSLSDFSLQKTCKMKQMEKRESKNLRSLKAVFILCCLLCIGLLAPQFRSAKAQSVTLLAVAFFPLWETLGGFLIQPFIPTIYYGIAYNNPGAATPVTIDFYYRKAGWLGNGILIDTKTFTAVASGSGLAPLNPRDWKWDSSSVNTPSKPGMVPGSYTIRAVITAGGTGFVDSVVPIVLTFPGDSIGPSKGPPDFIDNSFEYAAWIWDGFGAAWGSQSTVDPPWFPKADTNANNQVDLGDAPLDLDFNPGWTLEDDIILDIVFGSQGNPEFRQATDVDNNGKIGPTDFAAFSYYWRQFVIPDPPFLSSSAQCNVSVPTLQTTRGSNFTTHIYVTNATDLVAWQAGITFDPTVLEALSFEKGPFLDHGGATSWLNAEINNTEGVIYFGAECLNSGGTPVSGNGLLANITFYAKAAGTSTLNVTDLILIDPDLNPILANLTNGHVTIQQNVGGIQVPTDKFGLLAPWISLASTMLIGTIAAAIYVKRVKRRKT
jgi:hypothetical protein